MKYYYINDIADEKDDNGISPQVTRFADLYDPAAKDGVYDLHGMDKSYVFGMNLKVGRLLVDGRTNTTDVLSSVYFNSFLGLLMSSKLLNILLNFKLIEYRVFDIPVVHRGNNALYHYLYFGRYTSPSIVFEHTFFKECNTIGRRLSDLNLNFKNLKEFESYRAEAEKRDKPIYVKPNHITIDSKKIEHDVFQIGVGFYYNIINEKVRESLLSKGLTGFKIKELPEWIQIV